MESRTGEYSLRLRKSHEKWIIELEFFAGGKVTLHSETNKIRAEGAFLFIMDNTPDMTRLAKRLLSQKTA